MKVVRSVLLVMMIPELVHTVLSFAYTRDLIKYVEVLCDTDQPSVEQVEGLTDGELMGKMYELGYRLHLSINRQRYYQWCCRVDCNIKSKSGLKFLESLNIRPEMSHPLRQAHYIELASYP